MASHRVNASLAAGLALLLGGSAIGHFKNTEFFEEMIPEWIPASPRTTVYVSGAVELACAALLMRPATRRLGGLAAAATLIGVFPGNVKSALDGGVKGAKPPFDSRLAAWLRLPVQIPFVWAAWRVARRARREEG